MPEFSEKSLAKLKTCDERLQRLFLEVVKHYDCTVICGHRSKEEQDDAVRTGHSKLAWPNSKHNTLPSKAADVVPYPIDWMDTHRFFHFAGFVLATAKQLGINIRCGVDWNGDLNFKNDSFFDAPHFELEEKV
jgi:peptidoglycan L-alanyl-D-glutamate endopeptidase CwlK